jgi:hypothetical protein
MKLIKKVLCISIAGLIHSHAFALDGDSISIKGSASSPSTLPTGSGDITVGRLDFAIDAKQTQKGTTGTYDARIFACLTNGQFDPECSGPDKTFHPIGHQKGMIRCLSANSETHTIWFSGKITEILQHDLRTPPEYNQLIAELVQKGDWIFYGRLQDTDGDGIADNRSFFSEQADHAVPNVITTDGTVWSSGYLNSQGDLTGGNLTGSNACLGRDLLMQAADYVVVNGNENQIQWLGAFNAEPFDDVVEGTASTMAQPPAGVIYPIFAPTRDLSPSNLRIDAE